MPRRAPLLLALFLAACGVEEPGGPANVLLISLDSTRRDVLGLYGYESPHAPGVTNTSHLGGLAAGGVVMEEAYATTSWTLPSHLSMLTGEPELVHAVDLDHQRLDPGRPLLAETLAAHGFRTAGFFSGPYLEPHFGFGRGFETYEAHYGSEVEEAASAAAAARERNAAAGGGDAALASAEAEADRVHREKVRGTLSSAQVTEAALAEMEAAAADGRPFFLFAHYFDPHYDYVPPAPYDDRFDPGYDGGIPTDDFLNNPAISLPDERNPYRRKRVVSDRDLEHLRSLYAGEVAWTDEQVGRLLTKLEELGLTEDTLVIVTADHGDEFFEHQSLGHRSTLFEEQVRVPMVLRFPGRLPQGRRVEGLVSTIDLPATVMELLDLDGPAGTGRSFAGLAAGEEAPDGRFVLGRIVRHAAGTMTLPGEQGPRNVPATRLTLLETYREGPIKITRERNWAALQEEIPPALHTLFDERSAAMRAQERLRWIDVQRFPAEQPAEHSRDFDDPRARRALENYQALYADLLTRRSSAGLVDGGARGEQTAALEALGYAGSDLEAFTDGDMFVFPPPGR